MPSLWPNHHEYLSLFETAIISSVLLFYFSWQPLCRYTWTLCKQMFLHMSYCELRVTVSAFFLTSATVHWTTVYVCAILMNYSKYSILCGPENELWSGKSCFVHDNIVPFKQERNKHKHYCTSLIVSWNVDQTRQNWPRRTDLIWNTSELKEDIKVSLIETSCMWREHTWK